MLQVETIHKYKRHLYSKAVEMQNCIKDADMKAWIPGNYENGPKYPVPDECGPGVLFLKYKGLDIFIPGKARIRSRNDTNENKNNENCKFKNLQPTHSQARCNVADSENVVGKIGDGYSKTKSSFSVVPLKRTVGVQWSINDVIEVTAKPVKPKSLERKSVETHLDRTENMKFTPREPVKFNRHTKYIVTKHDVVVLSFSNNCDVVDKPCSDVCKSNVLVSDDTKVVFGSGDGLNPNKTAVKPKGFVKTLIDHYNALDANK